MNIRILGKLLEIIKICEHLHIIPMCRRSIFGNFTFWEVVKNEIIIIKMEYSFESSIIHLNIGTFFDNISD